MSPSVSDQIRKTIGNLPKWALLLAMAIAATLVYKTCSSPLATSSPSGQIGATGTAGNDSSKTLNAAAANLERQREACRDSIAQRKIKYAKGIEDKKYWAAAAEVRECARILADPDLDALVKDAEVKAHLADITGKKTPLREKVRAIEMLARDYPDIGAKYQSEIPKLTAAAEKQDAAAEARRKRSEGIRIGMSKADVLAISWGKPERVNRTVNAYGSHEQWVYGSRSYLYFDGDALVSIQN